MPQPTPFLRGKRVHLHALEETDAPQFLAWFSDEASSAVETYRAVAILVLLLVAVFIITEYPQIVLYLPKLAFPD